LLALRGPVAGAAARRERHEVALDAVHVVASGAGHPRTGAVTATLLEQADLVAVDVGLRCLGETRMTRRADGDLPVAVQPRRVADLRMLRGRAVALGATDSGGERTAGPGRRVAVQALARNGAIEEDLPVGISGAVDPVPGQGEERDRELIQGAVSL